MDSVETAQRVRRTRRDRRGQHNRRVLVQAALDWLLEDRGDVPGMAALCERAGVYHSAFYAHFKHVDECIAKAVREGFGAVLAQMTSMCWKLMLEANAGQLPRLRALINRQ